MKDLEGDMPIDIQINEDPLPKLSTLIEEKPMENRESNANTQINKDNQNNNNNPNQNNNPKYEKDTIKIDETNYPIAENNKGLFNQFQEDEKSNDSYESNRMTLDEPVMASLKRDLFRIYNKLKHVITPRLTSRKIEELYNWDLWGPLIFCFLLCISLSNDNNESSTFVVIFVVFWIGGLIVTFNGQFLGANIGICQMICLLGYCSFPITVGGMIIGFLNITKGWMKCVIVFIAFLWSCLASVGFVSALVPREKELITIIPVILFFISLSLFVLNY